MYNVFIFDLDNTLVNTEHLAEFRGGKNINNRTIEYRDRLLEAAEQRANALISEQFLLNLRNDYPNAKFCTFTTAPRFYTETVLDYFYPNFQWDAVVAFEDVQQTKPFPDGVIEALTRAGADGSWEVPSFVMIGDHEKDILVAYRTGISSILFTAGWLRFDYRASNLIPDANVQTLQSLRAAIDAPGSRLPVLESWISSGRPHTVRAPKISHFANYDVDPQGQTPRFPVVTLGRLFAQHQSLDARREWHELTAQIHANKHSGMFPPEWVYALRHVLEKEIDTLRESGAMAAGEQVVFTCIPRKQGRPDRMERLVASLAASHDQERIGAGNIVFSPQLLVYGPGALSHHGEHLDARERFENVRDNLSVAVNADVRGKIVFVLDDVMTSGATLYVARKYLLEAGAEEVILLALAQAISG